MQLKQSHAARRETEEKKKERADGIGWKRHVQNKSQSGHRRGPLVTHILTPHYSSLSCCICISLSLYFQCDPQTYILNTIYSLPPAMLPNEKRKCNTRGAFMAGPDVGQLPNQMQ